MEQQKYWICQFCGRVYIERERIAKHMYESHLKNEQDRKRAIAQPQFSFPAKTENQLNFEEDKKTPMSLIPLPLNSNDNLNHTNDDDQTTTIKSGFIIEKENSPVKSRRTRRKQSLPKKNGPIESSPSPMTTTLFKNKKRSTTSRINMVKNGQKDVNFPCSSCPKSFASIRALKIHNRRHAEPTKKLKNVRKNPDKVLKCKFCEKSFNQHANRMAHERIHTGERPYVCSFGCGRTFIQLSQKNQHEEAIHIQEKPFKCPICDYPFSQLNNMKIHVKNLHGKTPGESQN